MNKKLLMPQEIEVFYIIPAIRKNLAVQMKQLGMKQKKIAELLHLEEAAVSQYLNNKRGNQVEFEDKMKSEIKNSAQRITDSLTLLSETQRLISLVKSTGELCKVHKQFSPVPKSCGFDVVSCAGENHAPNVRLSISTGGVK